MDAPEDPMHYMDCGIAGGMPHPASAHAPEELRQAVAEAILHAQPSESRFYAADAVLSVPGIADALADVEVYRTALGLACSDGWSDGASAMLSYIETAKDHIAAVAALYPEAGK